MMYQNLRLALIQNFNEVSIIYKDKNKKNELISKRNKSEIAEEITKRILANFNT